MNFDGLLATFGISFVLSSLLVLVGLALMIFIATFTIRTRYKMKQVKKKIEEATKHLEKYGEINE